VGLNLISPKLLDGNGVKAIPVLTPAPNSGSFGNKKNTGGQMGHTKSLLKYKKNLNTLKPDI